MKYIISDNELREFKIMPMYDFSTEKRTSLDRVLQVFLKDKKPVECIASGEVTISGYDISVRTKDEITYIDTTEFWEKYKGKNIEIYIKEIND